jgi:hypothetical protein
MVGRFSVHRKYEARAAYKTTTLLTASIRESHYVLVWFNIFIYSASIKSQKSLND